MQAEREGFDGAIIACFHDPTLWSARQAVDIPVVAFGESSMLLATLMGRKFGLFRPSPLGLPEAEESIARYGLRDRCVGVACGYQPAAEQERAMFEARGAIEEFMSVARELIARGAEVLIPGCGLIAPCLRFAPGAEAEYPDGLTHVDGVPILDVYGATIRTVETLVALKQAGSCWISRKGLYATASAEAIEGGRSVLDYTGPGFWDC
jgi:Asp/Glu/hydantoin racemase